MVKNLVDFLVCIYGDKHRLPESLITIVNGIKASATRLLFSLYIMGSLDAI